jgi:endoglucanase
MKKFITSLLTILCVQISYAQLNQKSQRIQYFSGHTNPTVWDNNKSSVYKGGGATVSNFSNSLPVETIDLIKALKLETTLSNGYWNVIFRIGVHEVNYLRMGNNPYLHLRLKWTSIAENADINIEIQSYSNDKFLLGNNNNEVASVKLSNYVTPSNSWQNVYIPLSDFLAVNPNLNLTRVPFIRMLGEGNYFSANTIYFQAIDIVPSLNDVYEDAVKVNQIGYLTDQPKLGIVSFELGATSIVPSTFKIITEPGGATVFTGSLIKKVAFSPSWGQDGDEVYQGDFSSFKTPGKYRMLVESIGQKSQEFVISNTLYNNKFRDALRFFYYSRSGEEIVEPYAEGYTRQAFYENEISSPYAYKSGTRDIKGGWFDAGDLHKDIHAQTEAIWYLLETLKDFQNKNGSDNLNIPESNSTVNDLYFLIKHGLDWMTKMWNNDGSVHFWVDYDGFPGTIGQVSDVSSGAASTLAGLFSKAYTLFKIEPTFSNYADDLLYKAEKSWEWLSANTNNVDPVNPRTGLKYSYAMDAGEDNAMRAFAAIELYIATGKSTYHDYFLSRFKDPLEDYRENRSWAGIIQTLEHSYINLAYLDYANTTQSNANRMIQNTLKNEFIKLADWSITRIGYTAYNIPMAAPNHMYWGSSANIVTYGYLYNQAFLWSNDSKYKDAIYNCVDWIMGRNPVNRIFVTGYGDALHGTDIYSFFWTNIGNPPPGYLCGNINATENTLKPYFKYPWKQYINMQQASILEPGIYWNAEYAWLMGYMASEKMPTSIENKNPINYQKPQITIYPNPTSEVFTIEEDFKFLEMHNSNGQIVYRSNGENKTINVSNIAKGTYLIKITTDNSIFNEKIIIK